MTKIETDVEFKNPNVVKTVCDPKGNAYIIHEKQSLLCLNQDQILTKNISN